MTLEEQWQEDVKQFDELAYLMWEVLTKWIIDFSFAFDGNFTVECALNDERSGVKRKPSAALPFDLAAARAGDEVEIFIDDEDGKGWFGFFGFKGIFFNDYRICENELILNEKFAAITNDKNWIYRVKLKDLRMKHPRRVGVDYSQFEENKMKENIADLVKVSFIKGELIVVPKDGVKVIQIESVQTAQPVDDWVDNWEKLGNIDGFYIRPNSNISSHCGLSSNKENINTFKAESQAIAAIAIAQLTQLMAQPCVNGDWKPDWRNEYQEKWCIECNDENLWLVSYVAKSHFLSFRDKQTAEKFLQKYRSYIEKAAPILFGVEL